MQEENLHNVIPIFSVEYSMDKLTALPARGDSNPFQVVSGGPDVLVSTKKNQSEAFYGLLSYRFTERLEGGAYYSVYYSDKNDHNGNL
jgi:hypothetical protein